MINENELSRTVKEWILQHSLAPDAAPIDDHVNLLDTGVLDSMGFIELLGYIESLTGQKIDLFELDPSAFTSIQSLLVNLHSHMRTR